MLNFRLIERDTEQKLFAVSPQDLSHAKPAEKTRGKIELVEFDRTLRVRAIKTFAVLALTLLVWSYTTEIADIAAAPGQLIPAHDVQLMRAAFDGTIASVNVKEGEPVRKGAELLALDKTNYASELKKYEHELNIAEREYQRHVHAEMVVRNYLQQPDKLPVDLSGVTAVAQAIGNLYAAEQRLRRAESDVKLTASGSDISNLGALTFQQGHLDQQRKYKQSALSHRTDQFALDEKKVTQQIESLRNQAELQQEAMVQKQLAVQIAQKQLDAYETAFQSGAASKAECLNAKIRLADAGKELLQAQTAKTETTGALQRSEHELAQQKASHSMEKLQMAAGLKDLSASASQIPLKMRAAERELFDSRNLCQVALRNAQAEQQNELAQITMQQKEVETLKATIASEKYTLQKCVLTAPVDGTVALMHVQGPGQVVAHGETLLTIVPTNEELLVEAYVPNADIGFVHAGQPVRLELPAYPYQQYGTIKGKVMLVDDSPSDDKQHSDAYRILVLPDRTWMMCQGQKFVLRKGLGVDVQIVLRKRRLLMMQLAPLLKMQYAHFTG